MWTPSIRRGWKAGLGSGFRRGIALLCLGVALHVAHTFNAMIRVHAVAHTMVTTVDLAAGDVIDMKQVSMEWTPIPCLTPATVGDDRLEHARVRVPLKAGDALVRTVVDVAGEGLVATRALSAGLAFSPDDFTRMPVAAGNFTPSMVRLEHVQRLRGSVLNRALTAGDPLLLNDLEPR